MGKMWFTAMGPVRAWRDGREIELGAPQQRAVLALLVVRAGHPVGPGEIIDLLWGENPPATAVNTVHRSVGMLRRAFEPGLSNRCAGRWLARTGGGYRLDADDGQVDLLRFRMLRARARSLLTTDAPAALPLFAEALHLWQGPAAGNLTAEIRGRAVFTTLEREYEAAAGEAAEAALRTEDPGRLLPVVEPAADRALLNEPLQARLMLMLAAAGHQAAALRRYGEVRARLAKDLGVVPGSQLAAARDRVLRRPVPVLPGR